MPRGWIRRLERRWEGDTVTVEQRDGTTRLFPAEVFWRDLFMAEAKAAVGEAPNSAVHEALAGATPEAETKIKALVECEGGDFLRGTGSNVDVGFGVVGPDFEDLSEPAHSDEDPL
jgi:hypothetical protein